MEQEFARPIDDCEMSQAKEMFVEFVKDKVGDKLFDNIKDAQVAEILCKNFSDIKVPMAYKLLPGIACVILARTFKQSMRELAPGFECICRGKYATPTLKLENPVITGREIANEAVPKLREKVSSTKRTLSMGVIRFSKPGNVPISDSYLKQQNLFAKKIGVKIKNYNFYNVTDVNKWLASRDHDNFIGCAEEHDGLVLHLPLPEHLKKFTQTIIDALIPPDKDTDVLTSRSLCDFGFNYGSTMPPIALLLKKFFKKYKIDVKGKETVVTGHSSRIGCPSARLLERLGAKVIIIDEANEECASEILKKAEILITCNGSPVLVSKCDVNHGVIIIDASTNGHIVQLDVSKKADILFRRIGPAIVSCLFEKFCDQALAQAA